MLVSKEKMKEKKAIQNAQETSYDVSWVYSSRWEVFKQVGAQSGKKLWLSCGSAASTLHCPTCPIGICRTLVEKKILPDFAWIGQILLESGGVCRTPPN